EPYYDFEEAQRKLLKNKSSWFGRKLWNEHLVQYQAKDYWFTVDFGLDMEIGKDFEDPDFDFTYNNTREAIIQGGLGKNLSFYAVAYENQGRFAAYYNRYAESIRPDGGDPAIVPGRGIAKPFMNEGYDYPVAEGYLSFSPGKFFNIQLGHGKNFIGDGYRSLLLSDNASPYPYLKLTTTFWKLKYTNIWTSLRDVRPEVTADGSFRTKYMASHYLSINATKRLNIGLFEAVLWQNDNKRGFDFNYLNPVIFYRAIEFSTGARGGNAIMGLSAKYKWSDRVNTYGQMIIDEFSSGDIFGGEKSWKNKLGFQLGVKYYDAFNIPNLYLQAEYNQVRPYTYSHNTGVLNYGHNNQSMAHLWGANFREVVGIARYKQGRVYGNLKLIYGRRGFDFNDGKDDAAYGGDIYRSERERPLETGVEIGQGNTAISFFSEVETGYIINPATNLKIYASFIYRNFKPDVNTAAQFDNSTAWVNFGLRTDIFNWYYDY
ncbi:MAG: gliding motility protein RemB, partial [Salegentibacter sp.]